MKLLHKISWLHCINPQTYKVQCSSWVSAEDMSYGLIKIFINFHDISSGVCSWSSFMVMNGKWDLCYGIYSFSARIERAYCSTREDIAQQYLSIVILNHPYWSYAIPNTTADKLTHLIGCFWCTHQSKIFWKKLCLQWLYWLSGFWNE